MAVTIPAGVTQIEDPVLRSVLVQVWGKIGDLDTRIAALETTAANVPALETALTTLTTRVNALANQVQQNAP